MEDGSGDGTLGKLERVAASYERGWIKVIALAENGGPSRARNVGWEHASQPCIAFLDADGCRGSRKLELQMAVLEADPCIALLAHRMVVRMRGTPVPAPEVQPRTQLVSRRRLLLHNPFPAPSAVQGRRRLKTLRQNRLSNGSEPA